MITVKIEGLQELAEKLDPLKIKTGLKRGLKKTADSTKTLASSLIREDFAIKKTDVDSKFRITATAQYAVITGESRPINLTYFKARQMGAIAGKRITTRRKDNAIVSSTRGKAGSFAGVVLNINKTRSTLLPGAFLAKVKAGKGDGFNIGVFKRVGKKRVPIVNKAMVSVSTLFGGKKTMPKLIEHINTVGLKTIQHEIEFAMGQKAAGPPGG